MYTRHCNFCDSSSTFSFKKEDQSFCNECIAWVGKQDKETIESELLLQATKNSFKNSFKNTLQCLARIC